MDSETITHRARIWRWSADGKGSWHFVTIDGPAGEALAAVELMRRFEFGKRRGFGSVKVTVTIGETQWRTSVFPMKGRTGWHLPIKASVRRAEGLEEDSQITISLVPV